MLIIVEWYMDHYQKMEKFQITTKKYVSDFLFSEIKILKIIVKSDKICNLKLNFFLKKQVWTQKCAVQKASVDVDVNISYY
jgi:hypothetical protein